MIDYKDDIIIYETKSGIYGGNKVVTDFVQTKALFISSSELSLQDQRLYTTSDYICYVPPSLEFIKQKDYNLIGLYVKTLIYTSSTYLITSIEIARDHLLSNKIDNVRLILRSVDDLLVIS